MLENMTYEYYESVDSTNERMKERAKGGARQGLVISADAQTKGRGRNQRIWNAPSCQSIATSILIRPTEINLNSAMWITLAAGLAARDAVEKISGISGLIKWPNDIVVNGKKLCGILVEMGITGNCVDYAVVGIGVNIHNTEFSKDIEYKATSIDLELEKTGSGNKKISRKELMQEIWEQFRVYYNEFILTGHFFELKKRYETYLVNTGKRIRIEHYKKSYEAVAVGIADNGSLVIDIDGVKKEVCAEEVSVRGLYGYV